MKRIYITGAIGSGKTYAARLLSETLHLPHHGLDPIVFDLEAKAYRKRLPETERDAGLARLLTADTWIIEGWYWGDWLIPMYQRADLALLLDTPLRLRNWRIISRFARRKLGLIADPVPMGGLKHLSRLLNWTRLFDVAKCQAEIARHAGNECRIIVVQDRLTPVNLAHLTGPTHLENAAEDSAFVIPSLSRNLWNLTDKKFEIPRKLGMTGVFKYNHPGTPDLFGWHSQWRRKMNQHIIKTDAVEWRDKRRNSPERRGLFKLLSEQHGLKQFEARLTRIPPGEASTWYHTHTVCEEWFYVLRGSCHMNLNGTWSEIIAGDSIATAPGDFHIFRNFGAEDCDIIMVGINHADDKAERREEPAAPGQQP